MDGAVETIVVAACLTVTTCGYARHLAARTMFFGTAITALVMNLAYHHS